MTEAPSQQQAGGAHAPRVTVAMPVYNAGHQLRLAVLSVVRQTFRDWELLIIDDGSTDNALQGISDIQDPRIRIIRDGANKGLAARLNEAIDLARGPYFARMDQDDVSYPERFAAQLSLLENQPDLDVVAVRAIAISDDNEYLGKRPAPLGHEQICAKPWKGFYFHHPTWMGHTKWFRTHRYASPGPFFCEDQELLLRSHTRSRFATVDETLFGYRVRQQINWKKQLRTRWTLFRVQQRYFARSREFGFAFLSFLALAGRIGNDLLLSIRHVFVDSGAGVSAHDSPESMEWNRVLNTMLEEP